MYQTFYGLSKPPFSPTPDPRFLFPTEQHREALAQLLYGIEAKRGFMVLTGEAGTGKTTLLRALCQRLDGRAAVAFVFNSTLDFDDLLEYALEDLDAPKIGTTRAQRLMALNVFLTERRRAGLNTVLILDEAQNLDRRTLEEIRLLSNFETSTEKLLQIVLAGQPELGERLELPELRQLKQRITLRCRIAPLSTGEVAEYIRARLRIAGARSLDLFSVAAVRRIARYSGGIPRLINTVCDHCLVFGYAERQRQIEATVVAQAIRALEDGARKDWRRGPGAAWRAAFRMWRPRLIAGAVVAAVGASTLLVPEPVRLAAADLARTLRELVLR